MVDAREQRVPLVEERARLDKRVVERDVVEIRTARGQRQELIAETLQRERVEFERVPIDKEVDARPEIREEGDITVIPIVEERVVITKRLVLVEELRVRRKTTEEVVEIPVELQTTEVSVERRGSPSGGRDPEASVESRMITRTVTAVYDSEVDARQAREQLLRTGMDDDDVRIVNRDLTATRAGSDGSDKGMWESIKDFFVGEDDRPLYSEGLRRGAYLLTARVDDSHSDEAISLLERSNAIDLDERAQEWRSEGWTDGGSGMSPRASEAEYGRTAREGFEDEEAIPVAEERLLVGKREVDRGGVRVRSYVVEEPVHEDIALREQRVDVERRPASGRDARQAGADPFKERTVEVSERGEEAVVSKEPVVTEEVVVRKAEEERIESVDDTVRRTEVEVDDKRKGPKNSSGRKTRR